MDLISLIIQVITIEYTKTLGKKTPYTIMKHFLSIIMPCYNCEKTVKQAVESIFTQSLKVPFEIIMVDDGSSDSTAHIIADISEERKEIKGFFHEHNRGGGAARNTAVANSKGDIIFCLDSDDMMGENMLSPMISLLVNEKLDGVGIHISRKFIGSNVKRIAFTNEFGYVNQTIPFESLFDGSVCALYSTFLYTRKAFDLCGGYPTEHGFDTQSFAFRFLANDLEAQVCEGATYLHRVNFQRSYYIREEETGRVTQNWMKIYEEFFFLFSAKIQKMLLSTDAFNVRISLPGLISRENDKYASKYKSLICRHSKEIYEKNLLQQLKRSVFDDYWLGCLQLRRKNYGDAVTLFASVLKRGERGLRVKEMLLKASQGAAGISQNEILERSARTNGQIGRKLYLHLLKKRNDAIRLLRQLI